METALTETQLQERTQTITATIGMLEIHVDGLVIETTEEYTSTAELLQTIKGRFKELDAAEHDFTGPINDGLKRIRDFFRKPKERLMQIERSIKAAILDYDQRESARRRQAELAAQKILQDQRDREAQERAAKLVVQQKPEEAKRVIETAKATPVPAVVLPRETPKVAGLVKRKVVKWRFTDKSLVKLAFLVPDEDAIKKTVAGLGKKAEEIVGGIETYEEDEIASRSR